MYVIALTERKTVEVNPRKYRAIIGNTSRMITIPSEFADRLEMNLGTTVRIELDGKRLLVTNVDAEDQARESQEKPGRAPRKTS